MAPESAVGLCVARTHYDVEVEHFLLKLLDQANSDFDRIARHFGVDKARLSSEITRSLDRLKTGNSRTPSITDCWRTRSPKDGRTAPSNWAQP